MLGVAFPGEDALDVDLISRVGAQFNSVDVANALVEASETDSVRVNHELGLRGDEPVELLFEIGEGDDVFGVPFDEEPADYIARINYDMEPSPRGEVNFNYGDVRYGDERRKRWLGRKPTLKLQNPAEERLRQRRIARLRAADRDRMAEAEVQWLRDNQLFRGRAPAPGEEFGAYTDRIRGQSDRERQVFDRRKRRIDMHGNYAQDLDLSGFTADQFDVDI